MVLWLYHKKRKALRTFLFLTMSCMEELLLLSVSLIEFVNATCSVDELHLTSVEWVRSVRDLKLNYRVLNALDFDGLLSVRA